MKRERGGGGMMLLHTYAEKTRVHQVKRGAEEHRHGPSLVEEHEETNCKVEHEGEPVYDIKVRLLGRHEQSIIQRKYLYFAVHHHQGSSKGLECAVEQPWLRCRLRLIIVDRIG